MGHCNTKAQVKVRCWNACCSRLLPNSSLTLFSVWTLMEHTSNTCCFPSCAQGYEQDKLAEAVRGCDLVIVPAGVPRKPGMTRDDLFKVG